MEKALNSNSRYTKGLNHYLYPLKDWIPTSWKRAGVNISLATVIGVTGAVASGCANETDGYAKELKLPQENQTIVRQLEYAPNTKALLDEIGCLPGEIQISENVLNYLKDISADRKVTSDELGNFRDFDKDGLKNSEELKYGTDLFTDDSDRDGLKDSDEIHIYKTNPVKPNPNVAYTLKKDPSFIDYFKLFDEDGRQDENERRFEEQFYDIGKKDLDFTSEIVKNKLFVQDCKITDQELGFLSKLYEGYQIYPSLGVELIKLPDFSQIEEKDVEGLEDILQLATEPKYKTTFESMLNEGIPEKRKFCTPLEALLWIAYDREFDRYNPLRGYSLEKLIKNAWKGTTTSKNYKSERWENFDEVVDRLSSPELVATYCIDNFRWESHEWYELQSTGTLEEVWSPRRTFILRKGVCYDQSAFALHCLIRHGYSYNDFQVHRHHAACVLSASGRSLGLGEHYVCLYIQDGQSYTIDVGTPYVRGIKGPFRTVEQAADATLPGCTEYTFFNGSGMPTKRVVVETGST